MKYIKTFENNSKPKFEKEELVVPIYNKENPIYTIIRIAQFKNKFDEYMYLYTLKNEIKGETTLPMSERNLRKATPEEIEEYKIKINSNKYNL